MTLKLEPCFSLFYSCRLTYSVLLDYIYLTSICYRYSRAMCQSYRAFRENFESQCKTVKQRKQTEKNSKAS